MIIDGTVLTTRDDVKTDPYVYASMKHTGQVYDGGPYIKHVEAVFGLVYDFLTVYHEGEVDPFDDRSMHVMLNAALLHDVVEDCFDDRAVGMAEVKDLFGEAVADLVEYLTDPDGTTRQIRKAKFLAKMVDIRHGDDPRFKALYVKYADRIANFSYSIASGDDRRVAMYLKEMPDFLYLAKDVKSFPLFKPLYDSLVALRDTVS